MLFYDPRNAIHEMLDKLPPLRRRELLEDARPALPPTIKEYLPDNPMPKGHTLIDEFDHRDLETEVGRGMAWLDEAPQNIRMIAEDGDNRVDVEKNRIVKIVRKRNAEYLQGEEHSFGITKDGNRVALTDDVFDNDKVELESIDSEFSPPKDKWDLIFDATPLLRRVDIMRDKLNKMNISKRNWVLSKMANDLIYSSDWFPTKQKRMPHRADVKALLILIEQGTISKASVFAFCNPLTEKKLASARKIYLQASRMPNGPKKAKTLNNTKKVLLSSIDEMKKRTKWARIFEREEAVLFAAHAELHEADEQETKELMAEIKATSERIQHARRKLFSLARKGEGDYSSSLSITDKRNLWEAYYQAEISRTGEVKISEARFKRMYHQQCFRKIYPVALEKAEQAQKEGKISKKEKKERLKKIRSAIWKKVNQKASEIYRRR